MIYSEKRKGDGGSQHSKTSTEMRTSYNNNTRQSTSPVKFLGCSSNYQLDTELIFPLGSPLSSIPTTSRNSGWQQANNSICEFYYYMNTYDYSYLYKGKPVAAFV